MITLKKYKGSIDVAQFEKVVNQFLKEDPSAEVRGAYGSGYSITWENEGVDLGVISKSSIFTSPVHPTERSVKLIKMLAKELGLNLYKEVFVYKKDSPTQQKQVKLDPNQLKLENLSDKHV